jgi:hypothetical protein
MHTPLIAPRRARSRFVLAAAGVAALGCGCAHATHTASPQKPAPAQLTAANVGRHFDRVLVADQGSVAIVARQGCLASLGTATDDTGPMDEMRVRCPKEGRLAAWFEGVDRATAALPVEQVDEEADIDSKGLPAAQLATANGSIVRLSRKEDASRLLGDVRALSAELDASERPDPGPATQAGWQLLRVSGPAHVLFAGEPTRGVLDVRVSTTGQYLCEYMANTPDGPFRATKSGWIEPNNAAHAIDEVLAPFRGLGPDERAQSTYALAVSNGTEQKANAASTAAVFERVAPLQDALGDACIPELDAPAPVGP